jgi:AcrR family transcriptional regulator
MTRTPSRTTRANGAQTKEKILDAAETLFGAHGFAAVSLRDITTEAGVTLALASYHFGTKERLFEGVVARRAEVLCREREDRLDALVAPSAHDVLDAFFAPLFDKAAPDDPGWTAYFRVLARLGEGDEWLALLSRHFDDTARRFVAALRAALPGADPDALDRGFAMALHAMLAAVSRHGRPAILSEGRVDPRDLTAAKATLLAFTTAGLEGIATDKGFRSAE